MRNEFIKLLDEENIRLITGIFNEIYASCVLAKFYFYTIAMKTSTKECEDFRIISHYESDLKLHVERIYKICE